MSFTNGFHGRTMGALALTYKQQYKTPFSPMIGGTSCVPWLDFEAAKAAIQKVGNSFQLLLLHCDRRLALSPHVTCVILTQLRGDRHLIQAELCCDVH